MSFKLTRRGLRLRALSIGLMAFIILTLQVGQAFAANPLAVPAYSQGSYQICWATRASMIISFFKGDTTDRDITIAKDKNGSNINKGGTIQDTERYVRNYTSKPGSIWDSVLSFTAIKYQINNNGPIGTTLWPTGFNTHAEVIKGYNSSTSYVTYNDPWTGKGHSCSYSYYVKNSNWEWVQSLFYK